MKALVAVLLCLTGACSGSPWGAAPPYPAKGLYALVTTEPGEVPKRSEGSLDLGGREQFEMFVANLMDSHCQRTRFEVSGGAFAIEGTCDMPDGDFRGFPVKVSGTWTEKSIDLDHEITLMGTAIRTHGTYTLLRAADGAPPGR